MAFRPFNFQPVQLVQDPSSQLNWQTLTDNTKSGFYVPLIGGITAVSGNVVTEGYYSFYGPWVLVRIMLSAAAGINNWGTTGTVQLPTPVLITTSTIGITQYLRFIDSTHFATSPILIQNTSVTVGVAKMPGTMWSNGVTTVIIDGQYLRN